jgi:hypothetical protein
MTGYERSPGRERSLSSSPSTLTRLSNQTKNGMTSLYYTLQPNKKIVRLCSSCQTYNRNALFSNIEMKPLYSILLSNQTHL